MLQRADEAFALTSDGADAVAVYAANEAEKNASIEIIHISGLGRYGRMWLSGTESEIMQARDAAVSALESLDGVEGR